jgi:hypothetical protein
MGNDHCESGFYDYMEFHPSPLIAVEKTLRQTKRIAQALNIESVKEIQRYFLFCNILTIK